MASESMGQATARTRAQIESRTVPPVLRLLGAAILRLSGWSIDGRSPQESKYVAIFAPHTSNWDFPFMMSIVFVLGVRARWFGKKELFWGPLAGIFAWMGGIPIDRGTRKNMVGQAVTAIQGSEEIVVGVAPEGTRSRARYWKSGFYYIADQAEVPIVPAYLDYARKVGGFGAPIMPSGNIEADMKLIEEFYEGVTAKFPHEVGQIEVRPRKREDAAR